MAAGGRVPAGVLTRRGVTAADLPAAATDAQMDPLSAGLQALLAPADLPRGLDPNLVEVRAGSQGLGCGLLEPAAVRRPDHVFARGADADQHDRHPDELADEVEVLAGGPREIRHAASGAHVLVPTR
jgi:hypothetical protein